MRQYFDRLRTCSSIVREWSGGATGAPSAALSCGSDTVALIESVAGGGAMCPRFPRPRVGRSLGMICIFGQELPGEVRKGRRMPRQRSRRTAGVLRFSCRTLEALEDDQPD